MCLEIIGPHFAQLLDWDSRGIARNQRSRFSHGFDSLEELLLDVESFDNDLDDPIALPEFFQIIFKITYLYSLGKTLGIDRRGVGL